MKIIIDRIEGDFAVVELECGKIENIPVSILPAGAVQGSIVEISLLSDESGQRRAQMKEKMKRIFKEG